MYVCTFAVGNVAIQVVAVKDKSERATITPVTIPEILAVPFWPGLQRDYIWPRGQTLQSREDFRAFAGRWQKIEILS
jgi:hypothetical protein